MIELYTWKTPNGRKISILLEELGLPYAAHPVDLGQNQQFDPAYLRINPNNKIPAVVIEDGVDGRRLLFETGAILLALADREGQLLAASGPRRDEALSWLLWTCSSLAPMLGQWNYFAVRASERTPAAVDRFTEEAARLLRVLEGRLAEAPFLAGDYGVADISAFTWTAAILPVFRQHAPEDALGPTPNVDRWLEEIGARPAVKRGLAVP